MATGALNTFQRIDIAALTRYFALYTCHERARNKYNNAVAFGDFSPWTPLYRALTDTPKNLRLNVFFLTGIFFLLRMLQPLGSLPNPPCAPKPVAVCSHITGGTLWKGQRRVKDFIKHSTSSVYWIGLLYVRAVWHVISSHKTSYFRGIGSKNALRQSTRVKNKFYLDQSRSILTM